MAETLTKNKGNSATLPATEMQQSVVETLSEGLLLPYLVVGEFAVAMVRTVNGRVGGVDDLIFHDGWRILSFRVDEGRADRKDGDVMGVGIGLDKRQAEELPEGVGDLDALLAHATHASAAGFADRNSSDLRTFSRCCLPSGNGWRNRS